MRGPEDHSNVRPDQLASPPVNISAVGAAASLALGFGESVVSLQIAGTWVGTLVFEGSQDGGQTYPISLPMFVPPGLSAVATSATANGNWIGQPGGLTNVRARCTAYTSGGAIVQWGAGTANGPVTVSVSPGASLAPVTGTLTNSGDTVTLPISGGQWATARFAVSTVVSQSIVAEVSIDGGKNYFASAYPKRTDAVSLNPSVVPANTTLPFNPSGYGGTSAWEVALPANATHFQLRALGVGPNTATLSGGALYTPGMPVTAVLYDVTSAVAGALDTGTLDTSGWVSLTLGAPTLGTGATWAVYGLDDAAGLIGPLGSNGSVAGTYFGIGPGGFLAPNTTGGPPLPLPKRVRMVTNASGTTTANRFRIEARR
jgi:hypothetical protein